MPKAKHKTKIAASIHLDGPGRWTPKGRRNIAAWLRKRAADVVKYGAKLSDGRVRFSYHVPA